MFKQTSRSNTYTLYALVTYVSLLLSNFASAICRVILLRLCAVIVTDGGKVSS